MCKVVAEFEKGSQVDSVMLLAGVALIIAGFLTLSDTDLWQARDDLWKPISIFGCALVVLNMLLRIFRRKLTVELLTNHTDSITIQPVKNLQFSGWIKQSAIQVNKKSISSIKVNNFYNPSSGAGMYWVCFSFMGGSVVELNIDDNRIVNDILLFARKYIKDVKLLIGQRVES